MPNARRAKPGTTQASASKAADNDWWSWVVIAVIFAITTAAVWLPVIVQVADR